MSDETFEGGDATVMVDLSEVEEASFELIPKGVYNGVIQECDFEYSNNSGQPMWKTKVAITEGEYEGRTLFNYISFSPKALPLTKKTLAAIKPELLDGAFNAEEQASEMEGTAVRIKIKHSKYEGETRAAVQSLESAGDADSFMNG